MKRYTIAGVEFELRPLTLRQRQLAAPFWNKILSALKKVAEKKEDISGLLEISLELDQLILQDNSFARFLATILTPAGKNWTEKFIEENEKIMFEITEDVQAEVLQDFLLRQNIFKVNMNNSSQNSMSMQKQSKQNEGKDA